MTTQITNQNTSWADASEDSDVDKDGFKYVTEYITRDNKKYKVTKKIKVSKKITKINKKVQERKKWKPFGLALNQEDLQNITSVSEPIYFEKVGETALQTVQNKEVQLLDKLQSQLLSGQFSASSLQSGATNDSGVRAYRPPSAMEGGDMLKSGPGAYKPPGMQNRDNDLAMGGKGKYVPPSQRGAGGQERSSGTAGGMEEKRAVLINNLGPEVTEDELRMLFGQCGYIERCSLLTDRRTGASKGLAFITFAEQKAAEAAIARFDGKGLDHLIIGVEWAKPHRTF